MKLVSAVLVFFFVLAAFAATAEAAVGVPPCDLVCGRSKPEQDECCKAHGHVGMNNCDGGQATCD